MSAGCLVQPRALSKWGLRPLLYIPHAIRPSLWSSEQLQDTKDIEDISLALHLLFWCEEQPVMMRCASTGIRLRP